MDEHLLQIRDYTGEGFKPLVCFSSWRVALLRSRADSRAAGMSQMERHMQTDEVFVLTAGKAVLLIGGNADAVDGIDSEQMVAGRIYNVRKAAWHGVLLSRDASILIVENADTAETNSQYAALTPEQRAQISEIEQSRGV